MKSFCILDQGGTINDPLTLKKKDLFNTEFSDFYRLNWKLDNDPNATITQKNILWSEGRSLLYEKIPKDYDYYIFVDDDVDFYSPTGLNIAETMRDLLQEYHPIAGTFLPRDFSDFTSWSFSRMKIPQADYLSRKAFPLAGFDLQCYFFSKSFAEVMFPLIYHGVHRTMWYCQWACYKLYPYKQMCFSEIQTMNTRHSPQENFKKAPRPFDKNFVRGFNLDDLFSRGSRPNEIMLLFNQNVFDKSFNYDIVDVVSRNIQLFAHDIEKQKIEFSIDDFATIYNIENSDFINRTSIADKSYRWRVLKKRLLLQPMYLVNKTYRVAQQKFNFD